MATSGEVTPNDGLLKGIPPKCPLLQPFRCRTCSDPRFLRLRSRPKDRAKKAAAAGLPPSAAAAAAAAALEREALPAEVQVTVAVLGHQGLILLVEWNHFIFPFLNEKPVYIGLVWPVFLVCGEFFSQAILGPRNQS